jgi:hypothetical protein
MAFDLSTPSAQLAFGVAQRAQEVQDFKNKLAEEAQARVQAQLAPFGNQNDATASTFNSIYAPAAATQQARAKAMQEYVTGLPELLARVQAEKKKAAGGSGSGNAPATPYQPFDPSAILGYLIPGATAKPQFSDPYTPALNAMRNRGVRPGTTVKPSFQRKMNADRFG